MPDLMNVEAKLAANKLAEQVRDGVKEIAEQSEVNKALIFNNTSQPINFYVYNDVDTAYWISAMHSLVAPGKATAIAASGAMFKVHPNDSKSQEFLVEPHKAYIYDGPGDVQEVRS